MCRLWEEREDAGGGWLGVFLATDGMEYARF